jgi:hypothetical protein
MPSWIQFPYVDEKVVDFNGTDEYLRNSTAQSIGIANALSVFAWVKPGANAIISNDFIIAIAVDSGATADSRITLRVEGGAAGDPFRVALFDTGGVNFKDYSFGAASQDVWTHVGLTWDGTNLTVYQDGSSKTPTINRDDVVTVGSQNRQVFVAVRYDLTLHLDGRIHSLGIWNSELQGTEVTEIYNNGSGANFDLGNNTGNYVSAVNLQHWWPVGRDSTDIGADKGKASTLIDIDTNSQNITVADIVEDSPLV